MTYPFVPAESWPRSGTPIKAIVIHMAQGGGTVNHLDNPDGNSAHYVVEYSGRIVQMVDEARASGSINPTLVRENDDAAFVYLGETIRYGATARKAVIGTLSPNLSVIAIEVEGYAGTAPLNANPLAEDAGGPNSAQRESLKRLVADIRSRHGNLPCLGHRDFQNYKACPGKRIPWVDYGGHGTTAEEDHVIDPKTQRPAGRGILQAGATIYADPNKALPPLVVAFAATAEVQVFSTPVSGSGLAAILYDRASGSAVDPVVGWVGTDKLTTYQPATPSYLKTVRTAEYNRVRQGTTTSVAFPDAP